MRDKILDLIRHNPFLTQKEIAMVLDTCLTNVKYHMKKIQNDGIIKKGWIVLEPKVLSPKVLSPKVLSPKVLSPKVLSPKVLSPKVLSPKVLSPKVLEPEIANTQINNDSEHMTILSKIQKEPEPTPEYISLSDIKNIYDVQKQTMMGIIVNNNIETHTIKDRPYITTEDFYEHFDLFIKKHIKMTDCEKERLDENSKKVNDDLRQYDEFNCPID
jgi:DNA-binding Lrp family transcriptional regulator